MTLERCKSSAIHCRHRGVATNRNRRDHTIGVAAGTSPRRVEKVRGGRGITFGERLDPREKSVRHLDLLNGGRTAKKLGPCYAGHADRLAGCNPGRQRSLRPCVPVRDRDEKIRIEVDHRAWPTQLAATLFDCAQPSIEVHVRDIFLQLAKSGELHLDTGRRVALIRLLQRSPDDFGLRGAPAPGQPIQNFDTIGIEREGGFHRRHTILDAILRSRSRLPRDEQLPHCASTSRSAAMQARFCSIVPREMRTHSGSA